MSVHVFWDGRQPKVPPVNEVYLLEADTCLQHLGSKAFFFCQISYKNSVKFCFDHTLRKSRPLCVVIKGNRMCHAFYTVLAATMVPSRRLCKLEDLPKHLQFNKDILTGYRRPMDARDCVRSWKYLHNESFNCYSHSKSTTIKPSRYGY